MVSYRNIRMIEVKGGSKLTKRKKAIIASIISLGIIGAFVGPGEEISSENKNAVAPKEDFSGKEMSKEIVSKIIYSEIGESEDAIVSLSASDGYIRAVLRKDMISESSYKEELLTYSKNILEDISKLEGVKFVNIEFQKKFDAEYYHLMRVDMKKETLDNTDWNSLKPEDIETKSDDYWEHTYFN